jgi:hypothetical protein
MSSLVLELQKEIINKDVPLTDLLRKGLIIAKKLKLVEFEKWIRNELWGYTEESETFPEYRNIRGKLQGFDGYRGVWEDIVFEDVRMAELFERKRIGGSIAQLQKSISSDKKIPGISISPSIENQIMKDANLDRKPRYITYTTEITNILDTVKNILLDWTLKLEEEGILGNGLSFSNKEVQKANQSINIYNFYSGVNKSQFSSNSKSSKLEN